MLKLGIYNVVTDGFRWRHLIFYEKDTPLTKDETAKIHANMTKAKSAYVLYSTEHGYHVMGLTPVSTVVWAYGFKDLDMDLKGNCSGHVLRINQKPREEQLFMRIGNIHDFPVCDQIFSLVVNKWKFNGYYTKDVTVQKWKSLFCIYEDTGHLATRPQPMKRPDWEKIKRAGISKPEGNLSVLHETPTLYNMEASI